MYRSAQLRNISISLSCLNTSFPETQFLTGHFSILLICKQQNQPRFKAHAHGYCSFYKSFCSCWRRRRRCQPRGLRRLHCGPTKTPETKLINISLKPESFYNFDKFSSRIFFYTSWKLFESFILSYYLSTNVLLRQFVGVMPGKMSKNISCLKSLINDSFHHHL